MKITISLILLVIFLILVAPATAVINVTAEDVGNTFITWRWDDGLEVSDIYVDGNQMCGYETTLPSFDMLNQLPCTYHNTSIFTLTDNGTNLTMTSCLIPSSPYSQVYDHSEVIPTSPVIPIIAISIIALIMYRKHEH